MAELLLVDDDRKQLDALRRACDPRNIGVHYARTPGEAITVARESGATLAVVADHLSNLDGYSTARSLAPVPTVVYGPALTSATVIRAIASGAYDCLAKPLEIEAILAVLGRLSQERFEADTVEPLDLPRESRGDVIVGRSAGMIEAYTTAAAAATTGATVLVRGESGTGKELLARAVHDASGRSGSFVALNCAAIVDTLVESELFGHERGAFTGATDRRPGAFEQADKGTLFLDEIGDATSAFQAKLLRALDRGEFYRVGGRTPIRPDVRIVAATNQDLERAVREEAFRADLFYRLTEVTIPLPPLRDRLSDVPVLARGIASRVASRLGFATPRISKAAIEKLCCYPWPGNVRELQNVLTRALIVTGGATIGVASLAGIDVEEAGPKTLVEAERLRVMRALEAARWHRGKACAILGITRPTLRRKMEQYGLERAKSGRTLGE